MNSYQIRFHQLLMEYEDTWLLGIGPARAAETVSWTRPSGAMPCISFVDTATAKIGHAPSAPCSSPFRVDGIVNSYISTGTGTDDRKESFPYGKYDAYTGAWTGGKFQLSEMPDCGKIAQILIVLEKETPVKTNTSFF